MTEGVRIRLAAHTARDLMTQDPVTVHEDAPIDEAARVLVERGFSAFPVTDDKGRIVGVLSQTDLVRHQVDGGSQPVLDSPGRVGEGSGVSWRAPARVRELMTPTIYTVSADDGALTVISRMLEKRVHRIFVVDDTKVLVGVISSVDVLYHLVP